MPALRHAEARWEGDLLSGSGVVSTASTHLFRDADITWAARTEPSPDGKTSPEELLASAHASCFSMQLAAELAKMKTPPQKLEVRATVTFDKKVTASALQVTGWVRGIDANAFEKAAQSAKDNCPISRALGGNVALSVKATLSEGHQPSATA